MVIRDKKQNKNNKQVLGPTLAITLVKLRLVVEFNFIANSAQLNWGWAELGKN